MLSASGRLNGMLTDTLRGYGGSGVVGGLGGIVGGHHHHHHHLHGAQPFGLGSRFMPKLPAKRSMRAPRMRWTSTLHARFVHAVELLGGHESACPRPSNRITPPRPPSDLSDQNHTHLPYIDLLSPSCRGYAQVGAGAHGREGSDPSARQEPSPGTR
jgi:hypothetical protein